VLALYIFRSKGLLFTKLGFGAKIDFVWGG